MIIKIAIIEDNAEFLASFKSSISTADDLLLQSVATDCASAESMLQGTPADVLLVDLGLPDGNGLALIEHATKCWPNCDIMVVTVFGNQQNVLSALRAGASGYLLKDASADTLAEQIRILHAGGSPISPVIARQLLSQFTVQQANSIESVKSADTETNAVLSLKEQEVLTFASKGYSYEEVATMMGITRHTVATYVKRIYRKLQVNSKAEAIYEARRYGLVKD